MNILEQNLKKTRPDIMTHGRPIALSGGGDDFDHSTNDAAVKVKTNDDDSSDEIWEDCDTGNDSDFKDSGSSEDIE